MGSKEAEKGEIERLAEVRAKRRVGSWSEQFSSGWIWGAFALGVFGFFGLLLTWVGWANGELNIGVPIIVTLVIALLGWPLNRGHNTWEKKRFRELI